MNEEEEGEKEILWKSIEPIEIVIELAGCCCCDCYVVVRCKCQAQEKSRQFNHSTNKVAWNLTWK